MRSLPARFPGSRVRRPGLGTPPSLTLLGHVRERFWKRGVWQDLQVLLALLAAKQTLESMKSKAGTTGRRTLDIETSILGSSISL